MISKTHLLLLAIGIVGGYIASDALVNFDLNGAGDGNPNPFNWAFNKGAMLAAS